MEIDGEAFLELQTRFASILSAAYDVFVSWRILNSSFTAVATAIVTWDVWISIGPSNPKCITEGSEPDYDK